MLVLKDNVKSLRKILQYIFVNLKLISVLFMSHLGHHLAHLVDCAPHVERLSPAACHPLSLPHFLSILHSL